MKRFVLYILVQVLVALLPSLAQEKISKGEIQQIMMKATRFMVEKVSNHGGYLWNYSPDFSRCWGELEAKPSMIWIEGGTPLMGHTFLNAYQATSDFYYLHAAEAVGNVLIWGQHPSGGWPYMLDFAGEVSLKDWYVKVKEGYEYCAQEHLHYYGNCTYDDSVFYDSAMFLLRLYLLTMDAKYKYALDKCVDFILNSQYPVGGWPQRYPLHYEYAKEGREDYSSFITFNDGVHTNNVDFLVSYYMLMGDSRILASIRQAMSCVLVLQGGAPQAGWAMQYKLDLNYTPGQARDFEPAGYSPITTADLCRSLMQFYRWTGDTKYLARIPDAIQFIESVAYTDEQVKSLGKSVEKGKLLCPTFVEIGTNLPIYLHRDSAHYWVDHDSRHLITHYSSTRSIDLQALKDEYNSLILLSKEEATKDSPFLHPKDYMNGFQEKFISKRKGEWNVEIIDSLYSVLKQKDYLPGNLPSVSKENPGFSDAPLPTEVISIKAYMNAMSLFIQYLNFINTSSYEK